MHAAIVAGSASWLIVETAVLNACRYERSLNAMGTVGVNVVL